MKKLLLGAALLALTISGTAAAQARPAGAAPGTASAPASGDTARKVLMAREVFAYEGGGRRDPFLSLLTSAELRPMLIDLKLVAIAYDPSGRNSVAVLRDLTSKQQYKVRVGQALGRMRVAAIREKAVVFTIEEFGYSRQEMLSMTDSTKTRPPQ